MTINHIIGDVWSSSEEDVIPAGDLTADELLRLAASAEQASEHPLAAAIVAGALTGAALVLTIWASALVFSM